MRLMPTPLMKMPRRTSLRIGLDSDGVMYDFADAVRRYLIEVCGWDPNGHYPVPHWDFYLEWGMTFAEFKAVCDAAADAGFLFLDGPLEDGVKEGLERLRAAGHTLHLNTARDFGASGVSESNTKRFYDGHGVKFDSMTFTLDKTILNIDVMIEDNVANFRACEAAGYVTYLRDWPWNREVDTPNRVYSFTEFVDRVLDASAASVSA